MKKLTIKVEDYHIRCGHRRSSEACPIALALTPMLPSGVHASVGPGWFNMIGATLGIDNGRTVHLPPLASKFIDDYDSGRAVRPFEFEVEI